MSVSMGLHPKSYYTSGLEGDSFGHILIWGRHVLSQLVTANEPQSRAFSGVRFDTAPLRKSCRIFLL